MALIGFLLAFGIENMWSQVAFTTIFAVALAFALVIVRLLDLPFEGPLHLRPGDFVTTLHEITELVALASPPR